LICQDLFLFGGCGVPVVVYTYLVLFELFTCGGISHIHLSGIIWIVWIVYVWGSPAGTKIHGSYNRPHLPSCWMMLTNIIEMN